MKFLSFILKNAFRRKSRAILTIGSVLLSLFIVCLLSILMRALESDPTEGRAQSRIVVRHKVSLVDTLPRAYEGKLRSLQGIREITAMNWFGGKYGDGSPRTFFARFTTDPDTFLAVYDEIKIARGSESAWRADRAGALVGEMLMRKYDWRLGQKVTLKGDIYPIDVDLTIQATYTAPQDDGFFFHRKYVEAAFPPSEGQIMAFFLKADSPETVNRLTPQIDTMFENTPFPTQSESEKEWNASFLAMIGNVTLLIRSLSTIIVFVILLIAGNTMALSARERTTEIAMMRTLGFQQRTILSLILGESLVLSLIGGALGLGLCGMILPGLKKGFTESGMGPLAFYAPMMRLSPDVVALGTALAIMVGLLSGIVPALLSIRRPITDGLRQVA